MNPQAPHAYLAWSGGKDAALCLHRIKQTREFHIDCLLTNISTFGSAEPADPFQSPRIAMHGVRKELLEAQARAIGIPLETIELPDQPSMQAYESAMHETLHSLKTRGLTQGTTHGLTHSLTRGLTQDLTQSLTHGLTQGLTHSLTGGLTHGIYGDIFLEDLRHYRENLLQPTGIQPIFPLWQQPSDSLINEFIEAGFKAIAVCVDAAKLDKSFCGRLIDRSFIKDLPRDIDPCGENGEFHTFVFDGPIFDHHVAFDHEKNVYREIRAAQAGKPPSGFYFCDLLYPINA